MRQLRVVGLGDDHETVILEDPIRHERFAVSGDERLRAAARGDVRRLGQMEIEVASPLRPRDIQARVRAGESVDEVATAAGVSASHVERFAYPVLLERARVAEISRRAHPVLPTDPTRTDGRTLGEIVAATFSARGQDLDEARWDAHKGDDAQWVVTLSWQAGRSDNVARWSFRPGSSGGTVDPRDDPARELLGREPVGGPRRVDATAPEPTPATPASPAAPAEAERPEELEETHALAVSGDTAPARRGAPTTHHTAPGSGSRRAERGKARRAPRGERRGTPPVPGPGVGEDHVPTPRTATATPAEPAAEAPDTTEVVRRGKRSHPIVPSWEDVLLGTRSPRS
ncbi:septation protein SepH [Actinomycetospora lutea]|uniref:septation protein SepH n=1 Tax=Actinomycetospora lutea TaxID=663604 RepID=UPI002366C60E|nr:septation protein SepH [Actinomycetospora lutea]MDD7942718.1 septation protein SepH [Actinomycetospora lutea]